MPLVGQSVEHRNAGKLAESLHQLMTRPAVLDTVIHPAQHSRGVLHRLLVPDLAAARVKIGDMGSLVERGNLEGTARAGRRLLEDECEVLAAQVFPLDSSGLVRLQRHGQSQQLAPLAGSE